MSAPVTLPLPADLSLLGIELEPGARATRLHLTPPLARPDGALYGGTGIAASVVAMEAATGREALWVTTQFVATTQVGTDIDVVAEESARGRAISQVQVRGTHQGRLLFLSVGSTATPRPGGLDGQYQAMPEVSGALESPPMPFGPGAVEDPQSFGAYVEFRLAEVADPETGPPMAIWARLAGDRPATRAGIAFLADMVPVGVARAAGIMGGGPSLDNSLRFGRVDGRHRWVLLELRGHLSYGAHAHGSVHVWSPDGELLAVGGQSSNMIHMANLDEITEGRLGNPPPS